MKPEDPPAMSCAPRMTSFALLQTISSKPLSTSSLALELAVGLCCLRIYYLYTSSYTRYKYSIDYNIAIAESANFALSAIAN